jgi:hypothetical protein
MKVIRADETVPVGIPDVPVEPALVTGTSNSNYYYYYYYYIIYYIGLVYSILAITITMILSPCLEQYLYTELLFVRVTTVTITYYTLLLLLFIFIF